MRVITEALIREGMSSRGGWSKRQFALLGVEWPPERGWKQQVIGEQIEDEAAKLFVSLRGESKFQKKNLQKHGPIGGSKPNSPPRLTFGKRYRGLLIENVPIEHLAWLMDNHAERLPPDLKEAITCRLTGRPLPQLSEISPEQRKEGWEMDQEFREIVRQL